MRALALLFVSLPAAAQMMQGTLPASADFVEVPFEVIAGTAELSITHDTLEDGAILDWGLLDPDGFRGYGGGNREPITVGEHASSRSYHTGPLQAGTWKLYIGKAKSASGTPGFQVTVTASATATLAPEPQRSAYAAPAALSVGPRWYAGDFHAHSRESGDAQPTIDTMAVYAETHVLDFIELSDHNTTSQLELMNDVQSRHPALLLIPGVEFTTYGGHANGIGATKWVDHRIGFNSVTADDAAKQLVAQGAVFSINHPMLDIGTLCIGCKWTHPLPRESLGGVEIQTNGWSATGELFSVQTLAFWDRALGLGLHLAALGGSDDHSGGTSTTGTPIGSPTTMVYADALSVQAIVEAVRKGRTVVKLQGPMDPMVELRAGDALIGDTVEAKGDIAATVTGGKGAQLRWVVDGMPEQPVAIDADPFVAKRAVTAPGRVRAEVLVDGHPETVTSHIYFVAAQPVVMPHGCTATGAAPMLLLALLALRRKAV
jgi:hypothetical protein